jgi:hypothetical protein
MEVKILVDWGSVPKIVADSGTIFPEKNLIFLLQKIMNS